MVPVLIVDRIRTARKQLVPGIVIVAAVIESVGFRAELDQALVGVVAIGVGARAADADPVRRCPDVIGDIGGGNEGG